jgi:predicted PurR-regulated permease PerM
MRRSKGMNMLRLILRASLAVNFLLAVAALIMRKHIEEYQQSVRLATQYVEKNLQDIADASQQMEKNNDRLKEEWYKVIAHNEQVTAYLEEAGVYVGSTNAS